MNQKYDIDGMVTSPVYHHHPEGYGIYIAHLRSILPMTIAVLIMEGTIELT